MPVGRVLSCKNRDSARGTASTRDQTVGAQVNGNPNRPPRAVLSPRSDTAIGARMRMPPLPVAPNLQAYDFSHF